MAMKRRRTPKTVLALPLDMVDPDGFGRWVARHIEWMRTRNYSPMTVTSREPWLVAFAHWCGARGITRPREVTKPILERYRKQLYYQRKADGRPLAFGSQRARLAPLRLFFSWMARENALLWNPASDLDMPKLERRLPRPLTKEEVETVLSMPVLTDPLGLRDRAILETLYSTGMRRTELTEVRLTDIDREGGTVRIRRGKGARERIVPIGDRAVEWIDRYLAEARPQLAVDLREDRVFLSMTGEGFNPESLTNRVSRYVTGAEIGKSGSCHLFRHTAATLMLQAGADVRFIQEMLGHASLVSTQIYTHVSVRALKAVHEATHPASSKVEAEATSRAIADATRDAASEPGDEAQLFLSLAAESVEEDDADGASDNDVDA